MTSAEGIGKQNQALASESRDDDDLGIVVRRHADGTVSVELSGAGLDDIARLAVASYARIDASRNGLPVPPKLRARVAILGDAVQNPGEIFRVTAPSFRVTAAASELWTTKHAAHVMDVSVSTARRRLSTVAVPVQRRPRRLGGDLWDRETVRRLARCGEADCA